MQAPGPPATSGGRESRQSGTRLGRHPAGVHERGQAVAGPQGQLLPAEERARRSPGRATPPNPLAGTTFVTSSKTAGCPAVRMRGFGAGPGDDPRDQPAGPPSRRRVVPEARGHGPVRRAGRGRRGGSASRAPRPRSGPPLIPASIQQVPQPPSATAGAGGIAPRSASVDQRHGEDVDLTRDHKPAALAAGRATRGSSPPVPLRRALSARGLPRSRAWSSLSFDSPGRPEGGCQP